MIQVKIWKKCLWSNQGTITFLNGLKKIMYTLSQISSDVVDTETRHLQNTSQVCYHYSNVLGEFYIHD